MKELLKAIVRSAAKGMDTVLVTVTGIEGSAPRGAGAAMLCGPKGRIAGTVGGGYSEYDAMCLTQSARHSDGAFRRYYETNRELTRSDDLVCGGRVEMFFRPIAGNDRELMVLLQRAVELAEAGEEFWLITALTEKAPIYLRTRRDASGPDGCPLEAEALPRAGCSRVTKDGTEYFIRPVNPGSRVFLYGAGHVGQAVCAALSRVGFRCTVCDNRAELLTEELFPDAERRMTVCFDRLTPEELPGADEYACVMTNGHRYDLAVTEALLGTEARYIGVMGSRRKVAFTHERLLEDGFTEDDFARLTTPIGLSIGSETPAEIAVSIAAQLIRVRSGGRHHADTT